MPIPQGQFAFFTPHPYQALGAPYGGASPWMLRAGVLKALQEAQEKLARQRPGWKIYIFDAYRPNAVQAYMVEREYRILAKESGFNPDAITPEQREQLSPRVFRLWGIPSENPLTPPPHSTGATLDCTLMDEHGKEVDMGSPIDENSDRSNPDYFATLNPAAHANRQLLKALLEGEGFVRSALQEWWHFSRGDQASVWVALQSNPGAEQIARYGRADLVGK